MEFNTGRRNRNRAWFPETHMKWVSQIEAQEDNDANINNQGQSSTNEEWRNTADQNRRPHLSKLDQFRFKLLDFIITDGGGHA